jgi:ABC-2 type transport system ATP-binding protein
MTGIGLRLDGPQPKPQRPPIVDVQDLGKRFPLRRGWLETALRPRRSLYAEVLRNVSFQLPAGSLFGLLGPNGAGKTTLLKILSTLVTPDAGTVKVAGCDVVRDATRVRGLVAPVVADERSLNWRIPARENLRLYGSLNGLRRRELTQRIDELLSVVQLEDAGNKMVGQFSSGMKQRLLIARALIHNPQVLLLDEPTRSLDPMTARAFRAFLRDTIVAHRNCTVLLATHDPEEALELCDAVAILYHGRLVSSGPPQALSDQLFGVRYRIWINAPQHSVFDACLREGSISNITVVNRTVGGVVLDIQIAVDADPADLLARCVKRGARISRFEKRPLDLADLMTRAIAGASDAHA